jgi:hypothetical protein
MPKALILFALLTLHCTTFCPTSIAQDASSAVETPDTRDQQLQTEASWRTVTTADALSAFQQWAEETNLNVAQANRIADAFSRNEQSPQDAEIPSNNRLDRIVRTIGIVRPDIDEIANQLQPQRTSVMPPRFSHVLDNERESPFVRNHVRLLLGRWLAQNHFYDEALAELVQIDPTDVLSPASVLFYKSLVEHQLLKKDDCIESVERLLENESELPTRFAVIGKMMLADLKPVKEGSLDEISRLMEDIRRRTGLNRSGKLVLVLETEVIEKLDKLIEQGEKQQQQSQSQAESNGQSESSQPMQDSQAAGGSGDGSVTNKDLADGGQWGDLPPAERAAAMAEMAKDLPPHYRAAIEAYFRRLAVEDQK